MENAGSKMIRVVVADDHPIVRSGIRNELAQHPDIQVIGEAVNGDEALSLSKTLQPDVLLLDINMPGLQVVQVIKCLQEQPFTPRVVVLSVYDDEEHVLALLAAGATGYILKDEKPTIIAEAVREVMQGALWLSPKLGLLVSQAAKRATEHAPEKTLTLRELDVLRMMARGLGNPQIAESLNITEATVKFHVSNIYDKLAVASRVEAVLYALRLTLVDLNSK